MDPRIKKLASVLVNHSIKIKKNDIIEINGGAIAKDLINEVYPGVPLKKDLEPNETLLCIDKARKLLGYEPQYSWRTSQPTRDEGADANPAEAFETTG